KIDARPSIAALHEPLGVAAHAIRRAQPKLGSTVVVQGSGAIGLFTLGLARLAGATRAIVVGGPGERLELAQGCGADVTFNIDELRTPEERIRAVLAETPGGPRGRRCLWLCGQGGGLDRRRAVPARR